MSYVEHTLIPGERILYRARLHWLVLLWPATVGVFLDLLGVAALLGPVVGSKGGGFSLGFALLGVLLLAAGSGLFAFGLVKRNATEIAVTNKRVLIKTGLVRRRTTEILLSKVESVGVDETVMGRFLGFGTVTVRGTGGTPEIFDRVAQPLEFRRQIQGQIEAWQMQARSA